MFILLQHYNTSIPCKVLTLRSSRVIFKRKASQRRCSHCRTAMMCHCPHPLVRDMFFVTDIRPPKAYKSLCALRKHVFQQKHIAYHIEIHVVLKKCQYHGGISHLEPTTDKAKSSSLSIYISSLSLRNGKEQKNK